MLRFGGFYTISCQTSSYINMKILLLGLNLFFILNAFGQVNPKNHDVKGYIRKDGTYIKTHKRTNPNYTNRDNYTTKPNVNPFTGQSGYIKPDNNYIDIGDLGKVEPIDYFYPTYEKTAQELLREAEMLSEETKKSYSVWKEVEEREKTNSLIRELERKKKIEETRRKLKARGVPNIDEMIIDEYTPSLDNVISYEFDFNYDYNTFEKKSIIYHNKYSLNDRLYIEQLLNINGLFNGKVDGIFTSSTIDAIKKLQGLLNVSVDGKLGSKTLTALERY